MLEPAIASCPSFFLHLHAAIARTFRAGAPRGGTALETHRDQTWRCCWRTCRVRRSRLCCCRCRRVSARGDCCCWEKMARPGRQATESSRTCSHSRPRPPSLRLPVVLHQCFAGDGKPSGVPRPPSGHTPVRSPSLGFSLSPIAINFFLGKGV